MTASLEEVGTVDRLVALIAADKSLPAAETVQAMDLLESYECWSPLFKLIQRQIKSSKQSSDTFTCYLRLAKVQYLYLEDVFAAAETCAAAVSTLDLTFAALYESFFPAFLNEDYPAEAAILHAVVDRFSKHEDRVAALERLCLLYEKKTFNEHNLQETYSRLLEIDPLNVKALRYFKITFTQNYEWEKVVTILQNLIKASKRQRDVFRVAQELAAIFLYQLDQPNDAILVLSKYCEGSPLDTSTIMYDAYQRLGNWEGCLQVLNECLLGVSEDTQRAVLLFRIAQLYEKMRKVDVAAINYEKSISLNPQHFESYEQLIALFLSEKRWAEAIDVCDRFIVEIKDLSLDLRQQVIQAKERLAEGVKRGQSS